MALLTLRDSVAGLCTVVLIAGCSGYRGGTIPVGNTLSASGSRSTQAVPNPALPPYTIYVSNECGNDGIEAFSATADGLTGPTSVISGSNTKLSEPIWLYDSTGNTLWSGSYGNQSVDVFRIGDNGNAAPSVDLAGSNLGGWHPAGITRDASGNTYVADYTGNRILVFSISASGNAAPSRVISGPATGLARPYGLIMDSSGNLVVANARGNSVETFGAGASGNAAPLRAIRGAATGLNGPLGLALAHNGAVYVTNELGNSIEVFPAGAAGNVAPSLEIVGNKTGLGFPSQLGLDGQQNVYVANRSANTITAYAAGADGNVAPMYVAGGLSCPAGLAVAPPPPKGYGTFGGPSNSQIVEGPGDLQPLSLPAYKGFSVATTWGANDARNHCTDCNIGTFYVFMADATDSGDIGAPDPPYTGPGRALLYLEAKFSNDSTYGPQISFGQTPDIVIDDTNPGGFASTSCALASYGTDGVWTPNVTPTESPSGTSIHFPPSSPGLNLYLYERYFALYCT
jgi:6-phosphogluconolactonase (cycloisomerase 2 family)